MTGLSWGTLPGEVLVQIFSYLHYRDTVMAGRVCRHWSAVSRDPLLLAAIVQRDFSPEFVARVVNCVVVGLVKSGHLPSEVRSSILTMLHDTIPRISSRSRLLLLWHFWTMLSGRLGVVASSSL